MKMASSKCDINEKLCYYVERRDLKAVNKLLDEGANATKVSSCGRSAVGQATFKGFSEILEVLLKSCEEEYISYSGSKRFSTKNFNSYLFNFTIIRYSEKTENRI